jgi:phospholipid/cholesterol/gamma-HCH transport system permease protein
MITREPEFFPESITWIGQLGRIGVGASRSVGRAGILLAQTILAMRFMFVKRSRHAIMDQMYVSGIKSILVISIVAIFTGMILALQTGIELMRFNQQVNVGTAVMVSMLREMGPFMTGLILAACVGSSMAAQLGTMVVSEEIEALDVMEIDPVVMPRLVAMMVMTPLLSFFTCMTGILGGGIVAITQLHVSWEAYINNAFWLAAEKDLFVGLFKAFLFGVIITIVSCHEGFSTTNGAVGVGLSTRKAVIECFLYILIVGYVVTRLFYL